MGYIKSTLSSAVTGVAMAGGITATVLLAASCSSEPEAQAKPATISTYQVTDVSSVPVRTETTSAATEAQPTSAVGAPGTTASASALQDAQDVVDGFYDEWPNTMEVLSSLGTGYRTFDPAVNCDGITEPIDNEGIGAIIMFVGATVQEDGGDIGSFVQALEQYRVDIVATGVCG